MNFGEASKFEHGSLEEALAELNLPTDPRRLIDRGYKFTTKHDRGIYIGRIIALQFGPPFGVRLIVSDTSVGMIFAYRAGLSGKMLWCLVFKTECWRGEFALL